MKVVPPLRSFEVTVVGTTYRATIVPHAANDSSAKIWRDFFQKLSRPEMSGARFAEILPSRETKDISFKELLSHAADMGIDVSRVAGPKPLPTQAQGKAREALKTWKAPPEFLGPPKGAGGWEKLGKRLAPKLAPRKAAKSAKPAKAEERPKAATVHSIAPVPVQEAPKVAPPCTSGDELKRLVGRKSPWGQVTKVKRVAPSVWAFDAENGSGFKIDFRRNNLMPEGVRDPKGWYSSSVDISHLLESKTA